MQTGISPNQSSLPSAAAAALPAAQLSSAVPPAYPMAPQFAASPTSAQSAQMAAIMAAASAAANSQSIAAQQNNNSVFYSPMHQVHMSTEDPTGQAAAAAMYAAQTAAAANAASQQQQVVYIPSTDHSSYLYGTLQPDPFQTASAASESALIMPNAKDSRWSTFGLILELLDRSHESQAEKKNLFSKFTNYFYSNDNFFHQEQFRVKKVNL